MPVSLELTNRVAVVTGSASGIGKSVGEIFLQSGAKVFEIDIGFSEIDYSESNSLRVKHRADLTSSPQVAKAIQLVKERHNRLDILVNCAGIEMPGNVIELAEQSYDKVMDTNVKSIFLMCKYSIPLILESTNEGSIINLSSDLGLQPIPNTDVYAASKGAIISLTKALSKNWAKQGLRVNCVAPGPIETPLLHRFHDETTLDFVKNTLIPAGRIGRPEEVSNVVLFLASNKSSYINGAVLTVNGGLLG
jgi:NAD(P)-dependent dehydrogenase (short-subunit alcohol dehydrogenase family)